MIRTLFVNVLTPHPFRSRFTERKNLGCMDGRGIGSRFQQPHPHLQQLKMEEMKKRSIEQQQLKNRLGELKKVMIEKDWNLKTLQFWENVFTAPGYEFEWQFPDSVSTIDQAVKYLKDGAWNSVYRVLGAGIHAEGYTPASNLVSYLDLFFDDVQWEKIAMQLAHNNEIELKGRPDQQEMLEQYRPVEYGPDNLPY